MFRTGDEHTDSTEATSDTDKKKREPGRLTPMPNWLMKWWIPLISAGALLIICTPIAFWWGGRFHWPSADGISVCITIAGAALAVSTWQQRIEDNAKEEDKRAQEQRELEAQREERERNRLEQIERDEYWKRREQIYQLLGSKNPSLRLSAVALLAELADSAFHSTLLNKNAKRQLQHHIIDTLCLQVRHEGLDISIEGTTDEHAELQREIISVILTRVSQERNHETLANWTEETISVNNASIITPLAISNTTIQATLDLTNTIFHNTVTIRESSINSIQWDSAQFNKDLIVDNSLIKTDSLPKYMKLGRFTETRFLTERNQLTFTFTPHSTNSSISFYKCSFNKCGCIRLANCSGESHANDRTCTCIKNNKCAGSKPCTFADVSIQDHDATAHSAEDNQRRHSLFVHLKSCNTGALILNFHHAQSNASVQGNVIRGRLKIIYEENQPFSIPSTYCTPELLRLSILDNTILQAGYQKPIEINIRTKCTVDNLIHFYDNEYQISDNPNETYPICCEIDNLNDQPFLFKLTKIDTMNDNKIQWRTGGEH